MFTICRSNKHTVAYFLQCFLLNSHYPAPLPPSPEAVRHERAISNAGRQNQILPKEIKANRFFWDSHWLEIWKNFYRTEWRKRGYGLRSKLGHSTCDSDTLRTRNNWSCVMNWKWPQTNPLPYPPPHKHNYHLLVQVMPTTSIRAVSLSTHLMRRYTVKKVS